MAENPVDLMLNQLKCRPSELARALGVSYAVISVWRKRSAIPTKRVKHVSEITGIPAFMLCPEFFPAPSIGGAKSAPVAIGKQN